jgi:hypothetical protein
LWLVIVARLVIVHFASNERSICRAGSMCL